MSKQQLMYDVVRMRIGDGTYGPGYRLVLGALSSEFDMSPVPVREALRRLEAEGWVIFEANIGARVAPFERKLWIDQMESMAVIEGYASAIAAPHLTSADIAKLRRLMEGMNAAIGDLAIIRFSELNREFHGIICAACPNASILSTWNTLGEDIRRLRQTVFLQVPERARQSMVEHENIVRMIVDGEVESLEAVVREHKMATVKAFVEVSRTTDDDVPQELSASRPLRV